MICADSSSFIAFTQGEAERDVELVAHALAQQLLVFSPVTVSELLSDPNLAPSIDGPSDGSIAWPAIARYLWRTLAIADGGQAP